MVDGAVTHLGTKVWF